MRTAALRLGLNGEQPEALVSLPDRNFVVQTPEGGNPSQIEIPFIEREKFDVREIEAVTRERLSKIDCVPCEPWELESTRPQNQAKQPQGRFLIKGIYKEIIKAIGRNPRMGVVEVYRECGIGPEYGQKVIKEMNDHGFLKGPYAISFGKSGNLKKCYWITQKGCEYAGMDYRDFELPGGGSHEHKLCVGMIADFLKSKGMAPGIEFAVRTKRADVGLIDVNRDLAVAYEFELPPYKSALENIRKDLEDGFDAIVLVVRNRKELNEVEELAQRELSPELLSKVSFRLLREFSI